MRHPVLGRFLGCFGLILLTLASLAATGAASEMVAPALDNAGTEVGGPPLLFVQNDGQFAKGARFRVLGTNHAIWLADDAI